MKKEKKKYHVRLIQRTFNDDGLLECEHVVHEQDTWAVSERKAECNVRHNSGYPYHGWATAEGGHWSTTIDEEVKPAFFMKIDGRVVYE